MKDESWIKHDFSCYDTIFHVAGIAHVSSDPKLENLYYKINCDLADKTAKKAKNEGVKQFIFMSSIIVYGEVKNSNGIIDNNTKPNPKDFYGNSKLQAEKKLLKHECENFKIAIIRPPMIYGKFSKGNYPKLSKMARLLPLFPNYKNTRSMLHIDNLCEFVRLLVENDCSGVFYPQNAEYVCTSSMVSIIAKSHGKKIRLTNIFNLPIKLLIPRVNILKKAFGNLAYDKDMSNNFNGEYRILNFEDSINKTEK